MVNGIAIAEASTDREAQGCRRDAMPSSADPTPQTHRSTIMNPHVATNGSGPQERT